MFKKYRKKPVTVEAIQLTQGTWSLILTHTPPKSIIGVITLGNEMGLRINTSAGEVVARLRDYIIKDTKDSIFPCAPDIFEQLYEEVIEK